MRERVKAGVRAGRIGGGEDARGGAKGCSGESAVFGVTGEGTKG